jgi:HD-GYP domain-containing protein (c-di-GMP phosphodiesterase class II)
MSAASKATASETRSPRSFVNLCPFELISFLSAELRQNVGKREDWHTPHEKFRQSFVALKSIREVTDEHPERNSMGSKEMPDWTAITQALLQALRERDPYTYGHCRRVGRYARLLAEAAGLNEFEQRVVEFSAMFHDIGKIGIPDSILLKEGRLNEEEEKVMREHPIKSVEIIAPLAQTPFFKATLPGIRYHHERVDGIGYPDGIAGDKIPLYARIILISDTFDAMTTTRSYRKGLPIDMAYKELKLFSGRQFDAQLVKVFLQAHPKWGQMEEEITERFIIANTRKRTA